MMDIHFYMKVYDLKRRIMNGETFNKGVVDCPVRSWLQFGSDIYCDSAESLYSKIKAFVNDEPLNVNWDYLWNEIVYPNTGNTNQIIRKQLDEIV